MSTYKYIVDILAKNGQFVSAMNQNVQKVGEMDKKVKASQASVNGMMDGLKKFAGAVGIAFSVGAVLEFGKASVQAYDQSVKAETALLTALKGRTDIQQRLIAQATVLMGKTLFDDDETVRAQSMVAAFVKEEAKIKSLIPLIQDMATAKQMDLVSASDLVTKTLAGEMNALGRYGIKVEGAAGSAERLAMIQKGLNDAFGGQAEAAAKVGTAALQQLGNEYGNLQEVIGKLLISQQNQEGSFTKILTSATRGITGFLGKVATWSEAGFSFSQSLVAAFGSTDEDTQKLAESMIVVKKATDGANASATKAVEVSKYQAGSVGALGEEITKLNEQLATTNSTDIASIQIIGAKITALEKYQAAIKNISSDPASFRTDKFSAMSGVGGNAQVKGEKAFETKIKLNVDDLQKNMPAYTRAMEQVGEYQDAAIEKQKLYAEAFTQGFNQIGQSVVDGLGLAETGLEGFVKGMAATVIKLISMFLAQSIAATITGNTTAGAALGPLAPAMIPAYVATGIAGTLAAFAAIPSFATGGIVPGNSMFGDKMMIRANSGEEVLTRNDPRHRMNGQYGYAGGGGGNSTIILQPSLEMTAEKLRVTLKRVDNNVNKRT